MDRIGMASLLLILAACSGPPARTDARKVEGGVRFVHEAPAAREVAVAGSFDSWKPHPLRSEDGSTWEATLSLRPGRYSYLFLVDGRAVRPSRAPMYEDDGFGGENGVLEFR